MKTINNVQKAISKRAAVAAIFLFACYALNAQNPVFEMVAWNSTGKNKAVLVTNKVSDDYVVIGLKAYSKAWLEDFMKAESEKSLSVERWMFNDVAGRFNRSETGLAEATQEVAGQSTKTETSAVTDMSIFNEVAVDGELHLEDWMFRSIIE